MINTGGGVEVTACIVCTYAEKYKTIGIIAL